VNVPLAVFAAGVFLMCVGKPQIGYTAGYLVALMVLFITPVIFCGLIYTLDMFGQLISRALGHTELQVQRAEQPSRQPSAYTFSSAGCCACGESIDWTPSPPWHS
jgi:hypothetical protein